MFGSIKLEGSTELDMPMVFLNTNQDYAKVIFDTASTGYFWFGHINLYEDHTIL